MRELIDAAVAELVAAYVAAAQARPVSEPLYGLAAYGYYDSYEVSQLAPPFTGQRVADRERLLAEGRLDDLFDESQGVDVPSPEYDAVERMPACVARLARSAAGHRRLLGRGRRQRPHPSRLGGLLEDRYARRPRLLRAAGRQAA